MKKLMLDIEALALETFATDAAAAQADGQAGFMATWELRCPTHYTCPDTR